jgi:hypothetical protein
MYHGARDPLTPGTATDGTRDDLDADPPASQVRHEPLELQLRASHVGPEGLDRYDRVDQYAAASASGRSPASSIAQNA